MKTITAFILSFIFIQGTAHAKEILILPPPPEPELGSIHWSNEYCVHGVSYLFVFGRTAANAIIERDRNGQPIPCVTQKTQNNNESK